MSAKTAVLKVSEWSSRDPLSRFEFSNLPLINILKPDSTANVLLSSIPRIFKVFGRASVLKSLFDKVAGKISAFCNFVEHSTEIGIF